VNGYEQGNPYIIDTRSDNHFVRIPKVSKMPVLEETYKTVFEKLVFIYENGNMIDIREYKQKFFNSISDDIYKSLSKRHNVLKKDFFEFVNETTFVLPKNKDILVLLSNILKNNIIILNDYDFHKVCDESFDKTIVISSKKTLVFNTLQEAEMSVVGDGYFEYVDVDGMKLTELKDYIQRYKLNIGDGVKKKADLISKIKELKVSK
jgi:rhodanese-related sulfurtransferase